MTMSFPFVVPYSLVAFVALRDMAAMAIQCARSLACLSHVLVRNIEIPSILYWLFALATRAILAGHRRDSQLGVRAHFSAQLNCCSGGWKCHREHRHSLA